MTWNYHVKHKTLVHSKAAAHQPCPFTMILTCGFDPCCGFLTSNKYTTSARYVTRKQNTELSHDSSFSHHRHLSLYSYFHVCSGMQGAGAGWAAPALWACGGEAASPWERAVLPGDGWYRLVHTHGLRHAPEPQQVVNAADSHSAPRKYCRSQTL